MMPPPLLAAVFPWDRERRFNIEKKLDGETVEDASRAVGNAFDGGTGGVVLSGIQGLRGHNVHSGIFWRLHRATEQQQVKAEAWEQERRALKGGSLQQQILEKGGKGRVVTPVLWLGLNWISIPQAQIMS
ncbi:hypothetical protein PIB30_008571 [Stylosanthes scabra]|uniref:Uncharacterized protein n=1 Tax=Stylosanthes scabra TaxID=79078 RepID=A0ABU6Q4X0_9FABA|nr:hypothetical protein [Stylosanthes scabra]